MNGILEPLVFYGVALVAILVYIAKVCLDYMDKPKHINNQSLQWNRENQDTKTGR